MSSRAARSSQRATLCSGSHCLICDLYKKLSSANGTALKLYTGTSLSDNDCSLDLRIGSASACQLRVKLDSGNLQTGKTSGGNQHKMCDFAVAARVDGTVCISVVELKNGAAKLAVIEQLQEGLTLLHRLLPRNVSVHAYAILATSKQNQQLKNQIRGSRAILAFGSKPVQLRIHKCGEQIFI